MSFDLSGLKQALERTLDDSRISRGERSALEELLANPPGSESELAQLRKVSFELVRERMGDGHQRAVARRGCRGRPCGTGPSCR
jgi:hypothetical protein